MTIIENVRKAERKNKREVDSTAYERTEVLNKSLRNRNERFTAAAFWQEMYVDLCTYV